MTSSETPGPAQAAPVAAKPPQASPSGGVDTKRETAPEKLAPVWASQRVVHLFVKLTLYYIVVTGFAAAAVAVFPQLDTYLPIGGAQQLLGDMDSDPFKAIEINASRVSSLGGSLLWMAIAIAGAVLTILPVSWTYMAIRKRSDYDQSLIETIMILPIAVTCLVILVHDSLALAFSLAGIVGVVRFRNTLKSTGDALYVLVAIGIGLSAGVGAMEVAIVMSLAFNYVFLLLWISDFGGHRGTKRYMRKARKPIATGEEEYDD